MKPCSLHDLNNPLTSETSRNGIRSALDVLQGRATERTLTVDRITYICNEVERTLRISKAALTGTTIIYDGAEHFARAYKYSPMSTQFSATYNGRTWVVTSISRDYCPNRTGWNVIVNLSETAKAAVLERAAHMNI